MIILVDFDDTVANTSHPLPGHRMGPPEEGALTALRYLARRHHIIILTGRPVQHPSVRKAVTDWLEHFQVPYEELTNVKPPKYDLIVDNRAIHFDSWERVLMKINRLSNDVAERAYTDSTAEA